MKNYILSLDKGILYMLGSTFIFSFIALFAALASKDISSVEVAFFRSLLTAVIVIASFAKKPIKQKGGRFGILIARGAAGAFGLLAFFYTIANMPLGEAITYGKTSPIFTALFAYIFLKEKFSAMGWSALFLGFLGILFITEPFGTGIDKYDIVGVLGGISAGIAYTSVRELREYYDTRVIVLSFALISTLSTALLMLLGEFIHIPWLDFAVAKFSMPSLTTWGYLIIIGILATLSQMLLTKAYASSKAGIVATTSYFGIVFSTILGMLFLGDELPSVLVTLGILCIVASGILVSKEKH
jgi:drug/metabolite transporter (DMT)-like permease